MGSEQPLLVFPSSTAEKLEPYLPPLKYLFSISASSSSSSLDPDSGMTGEETQEGPRAKERQPTNASAEGGRKRPWTTLTFATSLDSSLALAPGVRTTLSGPESKAMTHFLRSRHDGILVGVGTAVADDPGLNCRVAVSSIAAATRTKALVVARIRERGGGGGGDGDGDDDYGNEEKEEVQQHQHQHDNNPRPIVLDPHLRWSITADSKVLRLAAAGAGKAPWIVTSVAAEAIPLEKKELLRGLGGKYIHLPLHSSSSSSSSSSSFSPGAYEWMTLLETLWENGIGSLMVEGGGRVINSLLAASSARGWDNNDGMEAGGSNSCPNVVESVIVTIAPTWLGVGGVVVSPERRDPDTPAARLRDAKWLPMGDDVVLCGRLGAGGGSS